MSRLADLQRLYDILDRLQERVGVHHLAKCHGRMPWPQRGVYFFFETGEERTTSGTGPRVVRVGTHALTAKSTRKLWNRLSQHRGVTSTGSGNHRGSIFRLLVGEALLRRDGIDGPTWGIGSSQGEAARRVGLPVHTLQEAELPVEREVSRIIGTMPFVWVEVEDAPGPTSRRAFIERNAIALLSNFGKQSIDPPSVSWLGLHSGRERVRESGLWNNNHVEEPYDAAFLDALS